MSMNTITIKPMDAPTAALACAAGVLRDAQHASAATSPVVALVRAADQLTATAALLLAHSGTSVDHASGLSAEQILRLDAQLVDGDARRLCQLADTLRQMPGLARAVEDGLLSASQTSAIAGETRRVTTTGRSMIDQQITQRASQLTNAEPEQLVEEVRDLVWQDRDDLQRARERRSIDGSFLALQARFDGGGSLYGHADAESFATLTTALDANAGAPDPTLTRARQRMDALIGICEASLTGDASSTRPRPRFLVTTSLTQLMELGASEAARLLGSTPGRPQRITPLATQILACDAELTPVILLDGQPIGIGDTRATIPPKIRAALIARDGGCRFPGCHAPAAWTDAHHILSRARGGTNRLDNLVLLCRRCHRRIHLYGWTITINPNDTITFQHRKRRHTSHPRARPPSHT